MRSSSKQQLQRMHAILDKQLQDQDQGIKNGPNLNKKYKQKSDLNHLRYSSNINCEDIKIQKPDQNSRQNEISQQKPSIFKKSLQKNYKFKQQLVKSKRQYGDISSSDQQKRQRQNTLSQSKNSMRGSRKSQINELQKKLLDLEKKMENIGLTSSQDNDQYKITDKKREIVKSAVNIPKNNSKRSFDTLKLKQNGSQSANIVHQHDSKNTNQGTARFCMNSREEQNIKGLEKIDFQSNLPLSHRQNYRQQDQQQSDSDDYFNEKYEKFAKIGRGTTSNKPMKQRQKKQQSEQEDSSDQNQKNRLHNKSISQQIQRLSITNNQSNSNLIKKGKQIKLGQPLKIASVENNRKVKINTIPLMPQRKKTAQPELLQPKYKLPIKKQKSKSKQLAPKGQKSLSRQKATSSKNLTLNFREQSVSKKKSQRNHMNLDNSFRSDNSIKSKKSMNSLRSVGSSKSIGCNQVNQNTQKNDIEQKRYVKKIQNLQKQLQHFKRLSKRQQSQISDYRLLQIQYKKLQTQFKKSQQIRIQQKKIIQSFRSRMLNG